mmetsp:Transcript_31068/g.96106  ORF Transcript_31068/g.96106 Transcript_31068/m.96106 type:complete len:227 (-) Transcript_31068:60-740(-)
MIIKREREMSDAARQFDRDLNLERIEHQRQVTEKKNAIVLLKQQLQCVRSKTTVDAKYYRKEAHAQTCSLVRAFQQSERAQGIKINELEKSRQIEKDAHSATLNFLKERHQQLADDLRRWEERYAADYHGLQVEFERLTQKRVANLERLTMLKKRRGKELEAERLCEEQSMQQKELDRCQASETHKKHGGALVIQTAVRSFLQRKAEDDARRAADKKKKKAGKKKK